MPEFTLADMEAVFMKKEWVMDPAPWVAVRLDDSVLQRIYQIKVETLSQIAELEIQAKQIERDMYSQIAKTLG